MNNFFLRIFSSLFLLPIFLYIVFINNYLFIILLLFIFLISVYEFKFLYKRRKFFFLLFNFLIILFLVSFFKLRGADEVNFYYLVWIMNIVWLTDVGGYFAGRLFKGPKLSKWSPNKTISGFLGSLIFSQFSFLILCYFIDDIVFSLKFFFIQIVISLVSILGDLFFSFVKRVNNLKDYSNIIPGHGGLLDRIDGLVFAIIFSFILKIFHVY